LLGSLDHFAQKPGYSPGKLWGLPEKYLSKKANAYAESISPKGP